jgi:hypothetical protein
MKKKVLIVCFNHLHRDPRILRQIAWLKDDYEITTLGYSSSNVENVKHIDYVPAHNRRLGVKIKRAAEFFGRNYEAFYWNDNLKILYARAKDFFFDTIIANDVETLPLAIKLADGTARVVFDAHEYSPLEHEEDWKFKLFRQPFVEWICRASLPKVAAAMTVCGSIADLYESEFGKKFAVVTNASAYQNLAPAPVDARKIRLIYHGIALPGRATEKQIEMMRFLDARFELNLMLVGESGYIDSLKEMAKPFPNIKFLPPVVTGEIARFTNRFDIGIYSLAPTNVNNRLALPNKFFEYAQARLTIAVAPSVEMAKMVRKYDLGVVAEDFAPTSLAEKINALSVEKINYYKSQAHLYARELSSEANREIFLSLIDG